MNSRSKDSAYYGGIFQEGYGVVSKYVMRDDTLSLAAKGLYAYLCSYTGGGKNTCFPSRTSICCDLDISKDLFYKSLKELVRKDYLKIQKKDNGPQSFDSNLYVIQQHPDSLQREPANEWEKDVFQKIRVDGILGAGYGLISRQVMRDSSLPIKAKGLYAYFWVYAAVSLRISSASVQLLTAQVQRDLHISPSAYQKYITTLREHNLLSIQKINSSSFRGNEYVLHVETLSSVSCENTQKGSSSTDLCIIEKPDTQNHDMRKSDVQKTDTQNSDMREPDTNISVLNSTSVPITVVSINSSSSWNDDEEFMSEIKQQIQAGDDPLLQKMQSLIKRYAAGRIKQVTVGEECYSKEELQEIFLDLLHDDFLFARDSVKHQLETGKQIANLDKYLMRVLLNAKIQCQMYYDAKVSKDFFL